MPRSSSKSKGSKQQKNFIHDFTRPSSGSMGSSEIPVPPPYPCPPHPSLSLRPENKSRVGRRGGREVGPSLYRELPPLRSASTADVEDDQYFQERNQVVFPSQLEEREEVNYENKAGGVIATMLKTIRQALKSPSQRVFDIGLVKTRSLCKMFGQSYVEDSLRKMARELQDTLKTERMIALLRLMEEEIS